jgi:hypothetical protein
MANISKKPDFIFLPSAVKESKAYSQTPNDGTGDFTFYRNSTTTRINERGQVERWPKNLYSNSNNFSGWNYAGTTLVSSNAPAPDGTLTASTVNFNTGTGTNQLYIQYNLQFSQAITCSIYIRLRSGGLNGSAELNFGFYEAGFQVKTYTITGDWTRISYTLPTGFADTDDNRTSWMWSSNTYGNLTVDIWGAQLEYGGLTPYMPTTTRLNLPTIDYSDGGPTLLLNPERTNLAIYSEDFSNAVWTKQSGVSVTTNQVIAPDGTLTADLVIGAGNSHGIYQANNAPVSSSLPSTKSIWMRGVNGGEVVILKDPHLTIGTLSCTLTKSWQRFVLTETQTIGTAGLWVASIPTTGIYLWGAQIENAPNASSYIPTIGSTVTRALEGGITNFIPKSNRVTVYAEFKLESTSQNVALYGFRPAGAGYTVSNIYYLYLWGTDSNKFGFNTANGDLYGISNSTIADGKYHKVIAVFDYTNFANNELYIDGVKQTISQVKGTTTQITTKNNFSTLYAQGTTSADEDPRIAYREMAIWDTELTDAECIDLTFQTSLSNALVNKHRQLVLGSGGVVEAENLLNNNLTNLK